MRVLLIFMFYQIFFLPRDEPMYLCEVNKNKNSKPRKLKIFKRCIKIYKIL